MTTPPPRPPLLTDEERRTLEAAYRHALGAVRALAPILGVECPIVPREERRRHAAQVGPERDDWGAP